MITENYNELYDNFTKLAVDPVGFSTIARPGRIPPDPLTCLKIQCGALTQADVGPDMLADCSFGGFAGVRSCKDPLCGPMCQAPTPMVAEQTKVFEDAINSGPQSTIDKIPYSPPNGPEPNPFFGRSKLGNETKRRRDTYQEMVQCPGGEVSLFQMGWNTWGEGMEAVVDKLQTLKDLRFEEIAGLLGPPVLATGAAWLLFGTRTNSGRGRF